MSFEREERMVAALGVEPRWSPYKEAILPLNDAAPKLGREGVNRTLVVGTKIQRPAIERPRAGAPGRIRTPVVPGRNGMHKSALPRAHLILVLAAGVEPT